VTFRLSRRGRSVGRVRERESVGPPSAASAPPPSRVSAPAAPRSPVRRGRGISGIVALARSRVETYLARSRVETYLARPRVETRNSRVETQNLSRDAARNLRGGVASLPSTLPPASASTCRDVCGPDVCHVLVASSPPRHGCVYCRASFGTLSSHPSARRARHSARRCGSPTRSRSSRTSSSR
jgi:hypothetical protein